MLSLRRSALAFALIGILSAGRGFADTELERNQEAAREAAENASRVSKRITPLMFAAGTGDLFQVRQLLARGAAVNTRTQNGETALWQAASAGHLTVVRELLKAGAALRASEPIQGMFADTPRKAAGREGHREIANLLTERQRLSEVLLKETQEEWNSKSKHFDPRRLARWKGLLTRGASPNWNNINGDSLMAVVAANDGAAAHLFLEFHADPRFVSRGDADLMVVAAVHGSRGLVADLLAHGAAVDGMDEGDTPLGMAVVNGRLEVVSLLLERGADPNREFNEKLLLPRALAVGRADIAALLTAHGAHK